MTTSIQMVHTADLHLGTSFVNLPEQAEVLQDNQFQAFMKIIACCRETLADILLIAGDLFEQPRPAVKLVGDVRDLLAAIPQTRVFIAPGNHDPANADSPWQTVDWPPNVHIFRAGIEAVDLPELAVRVYGAAFRSTAAARPIVSGLCPEPDPDLMNILLLHGDLVAANQSSAYNPISSQWLRQCGADYVALGHIHQGEAVKRLEGFGPWFAYCGCPAGRGFDELGPKGILAGKLRKTGRSGTFGDPGHQAAVQTEIGFQPISGRQFLAVEVDISGCTEQDAVCPAILQAVRQSDPDWRKHLYKIILKGAIGGNIQPDSPLLLARLKQELYFCKISDRTTQAYDLKILAGEHSLMGAFVRQVLAGDEPDWDRLGEQKQSVLQLGLHAFEGEVPYREDR